MPYVAGWLSWHLLLWFLLICFTIAAERSMQELLEQLSHCGLQEESPGLLVPSSCAVFRHYSGDCWASQAIGMSCVWHQFPPKTLLCSFPS